MKKFAH
jgi:ATPase family AAA domain-containing protein 3A/B